MEKKYLDANIEQATRTVFLYCLSRTNTKEEAEDLSQEILLEIIKSACNLRDDKAFYGFMWAVAGNVYKNWFKRKKKRVLVEPDDNIPDQSDILDHLLTTNSEIALLRRELSLLSEKHRQATVLYYVEGYSVAKISQTLNISESMVKYLLFKARRILKEGMNMDRTYGEQSYNPRSLDLLYMGEVPNKFWQLTKDKKIPQNILWACYNDFLTAQEISLQIGVSLPYLDTEIKTLKEAGLLVQKGNRFSTNIILISNQLKDELGLKTSTYQNDIADKIYHFILQKEDKIRAIAFYGCNMSRNSYLWHITCVLLQCLFDKITKKYTLGDPPVTTFGEKAYVWGVEESESIFNICNLTKYDGALSAGEIHFMDYLPRSKSHHQEFCCNLKLANFLVKLASNKVTDPNEYEKEFLAELIQKGYALSDNGKITVTTPVYTPSQFQSLYDILQPIIEELLVVSTHIKEISTNIWQNHVPLNLQDQVEAISCLRLFDDVIGATAQIMHRKDYLKTNWEATEMPTVYIITDN